MNEVSRRDDIESTIYMLLLMVVGDLPWIKTIYPPKDSPVNNWSKEKKMLHVYEQKTEFCNFERENYYFNTYKVSKRHTNDKTICAIPQEFTVVLEHVRNLKFNEKPDY
jgi:hypothetical protein